MRSREDCRKGYGAWQQNKLLPFRIFRFWDAISYYSIYSFLTVFWRFGLHVSIYYIDTNVCLPLTYLLYNVILISKLLHPPVLVPRPIYFTQLQPTRSTLTTSFFRRLSVNPSSSRTPQAPLLSLPSPHQMNFRPHPSSPIHETPCQAR